MSSFSGYKTTAFKETQKFFVLDPATGSPSFVQGSDLVSYILPSLNSVQAETTTDAAVNADYEVGKVVQTTGESAPGDGNPGLFLVVAAGTGGIPMLNGNEMLVLEGANTALGISYDNTASGYSATNVQEAIDNFAVNTVGEGSDLVAHTGTPDTVTEALEKRIIFVGSVAELEALSLDEGVNAYLTAEGREGSGTVKVGTPPSDPQKGFYIILANGNYWERDGKTPVNATWFGAGDGVTGDPVAFQAWADQIKLSGLKSAIIPSLSYSLPKGSETVSDYGVRVHGDPVFDIQSIYSVILDGFEGVEINASGASFSTDSGAPFVFYRSLDCTFIGGDFSATGLDSEIITDEAAAIILTRSINCRGKRIVVDGYYRNLYAYRAPGCGFDNWCQSINALYYNYYQASVLDVTLSRTPAETEHLTTGVYAKGGRFGNYFNDNGLLFMVQSEDCLPSGNACSHIKTERGGHRVIDCKVRESSVQNSGDLINGITAVRTQSVPADLIGVDIQGNDVEGCYKSYFMAGLDGFTFIGNKARNYYQTGFAFISQTVGTTDYNLLNGTITGNECGSMNDGSTRVNVGNDKNAGFQMEENDGLAFDNLVVSGNTVDALGNNTTKTPTRGVYIEGTSGGILFGQNAFAEDVTNTLPSWVFDRKVSKLSLSLTSSGTTANPTAIDRKYVFGGNVRLFNSSVELPAAQAGMEVLISATSSTVRIYVNGANDSATGSDTIYTSGGSSTQRNIQFNGPGTVTLTATVDGQWSAAPDGGTSVTVTT